MVFAGHTATINSIAFSSDGTQLLTASNDNTARLWDVISGVTLIELIGHTGWVQSAMFSPDGTKIATSSIDGTARVWDIADAAEIGVINAGSRSVTQTATMALVGHSSAVNSVVFSLDGTKILTASRDGTVRLWSANTGEELEVLRGHNSLVTSAMFSSEGTQIISIGNDNTIRLWDAVTGAQLLVLSGHDDWVLSMALSLDGSRIVTTSNDNTARIWNIRSYELEVMLEDARARLNRGFTESQCLEYFRDDIETCPTEAP